MGKDLEARKRAIWAGWQRSTKLPLTHQDWAQFRGLVERDASFPDEGIYLEDLSGLIGDILSKIRSVPYFPKPKHKPSGIRGPYRKTSQRRLYLVDFVLSRHLRLIDVAMADLSERKRIKWKQLSQEWNKIHPNHTMTAKVLKDTFYRAIREADIQNAFLEQSRQKVIAKLSKPLRRSKKTMGGLRTMVAREMADVFPESKNMQALSESELMELLDRKTEEAFQSLKRGRREFITWLGQLIEAVDENRARAQKEMKAVKSERKHKTES